MVSRRSQDQAQYGDRLPSGQKVVEDFPVLTYGSTPVIEVKDWNLRLYGALEEEANFSWAELTALPQVTTECDIHCVTSWSKMDTTWEGVSIRTLLDRVQLSPHAKAAIVHSYGGYTTNLLMDDLLQDKVMVAHRHNGQPLPPEHGGPIRLLVPHLYFWKSAKWISGIEFVEENLPGFWENYGYHMRGDPWKEERFS